jgi:hypothetical protein
MDAFGSSVVTLSPLVLSSGFPKLTLPDTNEPLHSEILGHYEELQRHVLSYSYRAAITSAKNIVEAIISPNDNFAVTLAKMGRSLLEAKEKKTKPPHPELAYHLAEKLRLLHPCRRGCSKRPLRVARTGADSRSRSDRDFA